MGYINTWYIVDLSFPYIRREDEANEHLDEGESKPYFSHTKVLVTGLIRLDTTLAESCGIFHCLL